MRAAAGDVESVACCERSPQGSPCWHPSRLGLGRTSPSTGSFFPPFSEAAAPRERPPGVPAGTPPGRAAAGAGGRSGSGRILHVTEAGPSRGAGQGQGDTPLSTRWKQPCLSRCWAVVFQHLPSGLTPSLVWRHTRGPGSGRNAEKRHLWPALVTRTPAAPSTVLAAEGAARQRAWVRRTGTEAAARPAARAVRGCGRGLTACPSRPGSPTCSGTASPSGSF